MGQRELFADERSLFEKLCERRGLRAGFKAVKKNGGAPGIDGVSIGDFESRLEEELAQLKEELESWRYEPKPVRRVEIEKPGRGTGVRKLGIPCVRDRVVQATMKRLLEPQLDPEFSDHSYGFRPRRDQRQAVEAAQRIVQGGKEYVVDLDLSKFFDRINHDRLIWRLSQQVEDKRILRLIGLTLRSGVMKQGVVWSSEEGTVQGSPLSPLLANVVLDELDKELERRGLEFCRFADDCNIFVRTPKAAHRVMENISRFIEKKLKLKINRDKSRVGRSETTRFLGMTIIAGMLVISAVSLQQARQRVKELIPRGTHLSMEASMKQINRWYRGWSNYYEMTQYPAQLASIEAHIRRRLRSRLVGHHKRRRHLVHKLVKRGVSEEQAARTVYSNRGQWSLSHNKAMSKAYPNRWFIQTMGQEVRSQEEHPHWMPVSQWIRLSS